MHVDFPQSFCRVGIARRDITPPVGIYHRMWGAATSDRSTGVHRPLVATALAVAPLAGQAGGAAAPAPQVIVALDHCLLWNPEIESLRANMARAAGLRIDQVHVTFSHTHAAGLMDPKRADLPGGEMIAPYLAELATRASEAATEAVNTVREARIVYGQGRCALARHRDMWDEASGQFVCGFNPRGQQDDRVLVARIVDDQSRVLATLVNYACHPTTLAWDNSLLSPDYVGAMRELVETATGAPCLFLQGASGDLGPRQGYVGDVEVADRNGRELGYAALGALASVPEPGARFEYAGPVVSGATLGTWEFRPLGPDELRSKHAWDVRQLHVDLPYRADLPTRDETEKELMRWQEWEMEAIARANHDRAHECRAHAERMRRQLSRLATLPPGSSLPLAATIWQLGDALWVFVEGEHYNLFQRALRDRFEPRPVIVATVTDGWRPGYLPTAETYGKGIYQESIAVVAPGSLEALIERIGDAMAGWTTS